MESVDKAVAKSLLDIKAVMLRPESPFTWASGWKSPIYCDNRRLLSYPESREDVCRRMADIITSNYPDVEVIAGVATGAIAMAIWLLIFLVSRSVTSDLSRRIMVPVLRSRESSLKVPR